MLVRMRGQVISAAGAWEAGDIADLLQYDALPLLNSGAAELVTAPEPEPESESEPEPEAEPEPAEDGGD